MHVEYNHKHSLVMNNNNSDNINNYPANNTNNTDHDILSHDINTSSFLARLEFLYRLMQPFDIHLTLLNNTFHTFNYTLKPIIACIDANLYHSSLVNVSS